MITPERGKNMAAKHDQNNVTAVDNGISTENQDGDNSASICQMEAGTIQAIDKQSVHRICSGQVVLTLATAVKELVENSIDAGATTVDIKLKEYGSENIEVSDNGSGVEERNFVGLTQKHHTSKLSDFSDLTSVETFGFRGEALSSLCALSNMTVTTRHKSVDVGTRLEYDANGHIKARTPVPRQQGTSVVLGGLFHTLPVRHKEFLRNVKKEFSRMVQVLNAYCLINTSVRITCSNQTAKGSRSTVVSTNGNAAVKDNIANIFGPKQLQSLLAFEQYSPTEDVCADYGIKADTSKRDLFRIEGFVSKCEHGQGRSSTDRQFVFINKRPCDSAKILKVINEVYHSYNRHQNPFVVLIISMEKESVDVNVTPDKRQIFMEGEKILLATIKTSLIKMYEPTTSVLRVNMVPGQSGSTGTVSDSLMHHNVSSPVSEPGSQSSPGKSQSSTQNGVKDGMSSLARLKRSFSSAFDRSDHFAPSASPHGTPQPDKKGKLETFLTKRHSTPASFSPDKGAITSFFRPKASASSSLSPLSSSSSTSAQKPATPHIEPTPHTPSFLKPAFIEGIDDDDVIIEENPLDVLQSSADETDSALCNGDSRLLSKTSPPHSTGQNGDGDENRNKPGVRLVFHELSTPAATEPEEKCEEPKDASCHQGDTEKDQDDKLCSMSLSADEKNSTKELLSDSLTTDTQGNEDLTAGGEGGSLSGACAEEGVEEGQDRRHAGSCSRGGRSPPTHAHHQEPGEAGSGSGQPSEGASSSLALTLTHFDHKENHDPSSRPEAELRFSFQQLRKCLESSEMNAEKQKKEDFARSFRAKIAPGDNKSAEEELQREISKDMFAKMDVLGQFNLGFIIAKNKEDLFIVDQHATDEKFNFEMLQRHTVLQSQQLIHPQSLELTATNEIILMDNIDIFRKNGFDFTIDETAPPTQRVKLKSTPVSKNWSFGKDDIEELIFMLTDSPGIMCRPSRVRMMFASRACRKSIMIGTHLNKPQMKKLLCHMGEIEQPWNCPHGRPTMRHLINLRMLPS